MSVVFFQVLNVLVAILLLLSLIGNFITYSQIPFWNFIINGIVKIAFVFILVLLEFRQTPDLVKPFSFMFYFLGRGLFYLFLGLMPMGPDILSLIGGFIIALIGIIYIILHLAKPNGEPEFMSFARYQRLTSGLSHELPTTSTAAATQNTYPVAHQVPLSQSPTGVATNGQYNNTHSAVEISHTTVSVVVPHQEPEADSKTEV